MPQACPVVRRWCRISSASRFKSMGQIGRSLPPNLNCAVPRIGWSPRLLPPTGALQWHRRSRMLQPWSLASCPLPAGASIGRRTGRRLTRRKEGLCSLARELMLTGPHDGRRQLADGIVRSRGVACSMGRRCIRCPIAGHALPLGRTLPPAFRDRPNRHGVC